MKALYLIAGAVLTLIGLALGFALATKVDMSAEAKWWDLMTAFGTVGAAMFAVAVPLWQNFERRKDDKAAVVKRNWAVAHTCYQICGQLQALLEQWEAGDRPSSSEFSLLHTRLIALQDRADGVFGGSIVSLLASMCANFEGMAQKAERSAAVRAARQAQSGLAMMIVNGASSDVLLSGIADVEALKRQCEDWMARVLSGNLD